MKILYLILARKGSKRLKNKNILKINKKTLIELTINFVKKIAPKKSKKKLTETKLKEKRKGGMRQHTKNEKKAKK